MSGEHVCVAVDLRGHGDSGWSDAADYGLEAHATDIGLVADELSSGKFVVVGQSLGGLAALTFAGLRPDVVRALDHPLR